jgi:hypothetical protein
LAAALRKIDSTVEIVLRVRFLSLLCALAVAIPLENPTNCSIGDVAAMGNDLIGCSTAILSRDRQGYFERNSQLKVRNQGAQPIFDSCNTRDLSLFFDNLWGGKSTCARKVRNAVTDFCI